MELGLEKKKEREKRLALGLGEVRERMKGGVGFFGERSSPTLDMERWEREGMEVEGEGIEVTKRDEVMVVLSFLVCSLGKFSLLDRLTGKLGSLETRNSYHRLAT